MSDQPKPTGEWTLGESNPRVVWRGDAVIGIAINHEESARFADAHNAAIANERNSREDAHICDLCGGVIKRGKHYCTSCAATHEEKMANLQSQMDTAQQNYIRRLNELTQELDDLRKAAQIRPLQ